MMEKRCQKGPQKSCFLEQNGDMDLPGSTYPPIIDVLVRCQKSTFLGSAKKRPKKFKIDQKGAGDQMSKLANLPREKQAPCRGLKSKNLLNYSSLNHARCLTRRWAQGPANCISVCAMRRAHRRP